MTNLENLNERVNRPVSKSSTAIKQDSFVIRVTKYIVIDHWDNMHESCLGLARCSHLGLADLEVITIL